MNRGAKEFSEARVEAGDLQADAAERFDVSQATVSRWEAGECSPRSAERDAVAEAYGVDRSAWDEELDDVA